MAQQGFPNGQPLQVPANVYELMLSHQLGRPLAFDRESSDGCTGVILIVVGVFIDLSLLIPLLIVGLVLFVSHTPIPVANLLTPWGLGGALFFLLCVLFGILIGWGGISLLRGPFQHLYLCQEGLVSLTGHREIVMRWDQVTSVTRFVAYSGTRNPRPSSYCRLRRSDGVELIIREGSFEHGVALCRSIERQVVHQQLPQVLASYHAGIPLNFGDLTVTQQGLSLDHGRKTLPWSEVSAIEINRNYVFSIGKQGKFRNWYSNASMSNAQTFMELAFALGVRL
jgi:hypothetical protein